MAVLTLQGELRGVTLSLGAFNCANGLVGVFIPLVILNSHGALWQVPTFYVTYAIAKLIVNYPIARFVVLRHGVHAAFALGFTAAVTELGALQLFVATKNQWWLAIAAIALAFVNGSLWLSQHLHISSVIETATKSSNLATIQTINLVLGIVSPFVGGVIGELFGPGWLIGMALAVLTLAFIPLRMIGRLETEIGDRTSRGLRYTLAGAPPRDLFANFSWNVESSVGELAWPIFLALEIATYRGIGIISALSSVFMVAALWVAGHRGDKGQGRRVLKEASTTTSVIDILRLFVTGAFGVTVVSSAYRASLAYAQNAWASTYYGHAKAKGAQWVMSMEIACDLAYLTLWSVLLCISLAFSNRAFFNVAFTIAACAAWGCLAMSDERKGA